MYMVGVYLMFSNLLVNLISGSSSTFPVWFSNPIQIEPETYYTACVILDGSELSYFGQVRTSGQMILFLKFTA